jgi:penicillin amidase
VRVLGRLLAVLLVVVVIAVIAAGGLLTWVGARALPQTSGTLHVAGLAAPVTVYRDAGGVAQIVADSPDDLFFAQGFVHASERMWQMEVFRHIGSGRLAELFGKSQVDRDRFIRTLGWRQAAERDLAAAPEDVRRALDRYAAGVNAWIAGQQGKMSLAFVVAGLQSGAGGGLGGYTPEPWQPVDSAVFGKVQAWSLGGNLDSEIFRILSDARLGNPALTDALAPAMGTDGPVIVPTGAAGSFGAGSTLPPAGVVGPATAVTSSATAARVVGPATSPAGANPTGASAAAVPTSVTPATTTGLVRLGAIASGLGDLAGLGTSDTAFGHPGVGSNDWVVAPSRSATGHALLANDPHLGIQMPSIWYMNGLRCRTVSAACPYDVEGVSFPGVPAVILGHNARIAWGFTNVGPDVQDLYVETPDPNNAANYLYKGASQPFITRPETIKVAGGDPLTITVRETVHGPIVTDVDDDLKASGALYALRWTATVEPDGLLESIFRLDVAGTFDEFRAALRSYGAPSQNVVYADVAGNIGYQVPGRIPVRPKGDLGDRPVDGASGAHDWTGWIPFDDLPGYLNPPDGIIVTANNAVVDGRYPYLMGRDWAPGWRAARIRELLDEAAKNGGVTQEDLSRIQTDTRLLRADAVIPALLAARPTTADGRSVQELLGSWDRRCDIDSRGCSAYEVTEWRLMRAVYDPWLGVLAPRYVGTGQSKVALRVFLADPKAVFWNDPTTPVLETLDGRLADALDAAGSELRAAMGDPSRWAWGRLHRTTFREQTLGESGIGPLEAYFDLGPYGAPGTSDAVNNITTTLGAWYPDPKDPDARPGTLFDAFAASTIPSYRLTIDMGDLDRARIVQTTGQSGNPLDRHYGDLIDDWLAGRTLPLPFTPDAVRRGAATTLVLAP